MGNVESESSGDAGTPAHCPNTSDLWRAGQDGVRLQISSSTVIVQRSHILRPVRENWQSKHSNMERKLNKVFFQAMD